MSAAPDDQGWKKRNFLSVEKDQIGLFDRLVGEAEKGESPLRCRGIDNGELDFTVSRLNSLAEKGDFNGINREIRAMREAIFRLQVLQDEKMLWN